MPRRGLLLGAWLLGTLAATLVAWGAVRQVTAEVSPRPVLPLPAGVEIAQIAPSEDTAPGRQAAARSGGGAPPPDAQPAEPAEEPAPVGVTEAYRLQGGVVTVRYRGSATTLAGATPNSGFVVEVHDSGPEKVDVRFESEGHESRLVTRMRDGQPDAEREERAR